MPVFKTHRGPYSGANVFLMCNENLYTSGIAPFQAVKRDAPLGLPRPEGLLTFTATVVNNTIVVAWTLISNVPKLDRMKIWIKSIDAKIHPQLAGTAPCFPAGTFTISTVRAIGGIPISLPPGKYQIQAQTVNEYGKTGVPTTILTVRVGPDNFTPFYFSPRLLLLSLPGQTANIPWTTLSVAGIAPATANAILLYATLERLAGGAPPENAILNIRRDSTQGIAEQLESIYALPAAQNSIIPLTPLLTFDYSFTRIGANGLYAVSIYAIGYIY